MALLLLWMRFEPGLFLVAGLARDMLWCDAKPCGWPEWVSSVLTVLFYLAGALHARGHAQMLHDLPATHQGHCAATSFSPSCALSAVLSIAACGPQARPVIPRTIFCLQTHSCPTTHLSALYVWSWHCGLAQHAGAHLVHPGRSHVRVQMNCVSAQAVGTRRMRFLW